MTARRRQTGQRMAEKYERRQLYVVEGNTAKQLSPQEIPIYEEQEKKARRARKIEERALQISPTFVLLLAFASALMLAVCVNYLQARASIYTRMMNVEEMEQELAGLKEVNEATASRIEAASDINRIYKIATEEMGMVYPEDSQIIYYDRTESEYVQQYEKIPED
ncbi:MAG: cell division protein FtsL [Lachnospiraceae bacterium]|nr:cell division protein FtsL [Lachnospiraceae bacterium]